MNLERIVRSRCREHKKPRAPAAVAMSCPKCLPHYGKKQAEKAAIRLTRQSGAAINAPMNHPRPNL